MFRSTTMKLLPLVCLCVVTRSGITFADENGRVVVKEDSDAVLPCSLSTKENIETKLFDWKKDDHKEVFMYDGGDYYGHGLSGQDKQFEGRVSHFNDELKNGNASIKIRKTKVADSGNYTCFFPRLQPSQMFHIELVVGAASKPSVTILDESKDWSLLQCEVYGASPRPKVEWRDSSGNILHAKEPQVTERGGSYDIILQTTVTKTDHYSCVVTQDQINHHTEAETYVHINGAASEPYVTILDQSKDWSLLQCLVRGASPRPKVEWRDSSGNILHAKEPQVTERGGSYDIILQTTVTKTDHYSCVVTQDQIKHHTEAEIYVHINGAASEPYVTILEETKDQALLQCLVRGASPRPKVEWRDSSGNILHAKEPQVTERGGSYDIILQTTVTKTDLYSCVVTQDQINHHTEAETYVHINGEIFS
ncbi:CD276 antigen-like isoform X3 [Labrus mixtus]|uniref:CD276 antigen-like isoform X3 n=1 Tax=Labrus mixtus TaxID=508554 RepID=UPI0029BFE45A|nr:CD276 antigen-like isoform X3 [Labrus mixtus]